MTVGGRSERMIVLLVGAVQFVNVLDFMMVMPLGPDFARALAIPSSQIGYVAGAYTAAAAVAGLAGSFFLDRFDRRPALAVSILGLMVGTLAGGFAIGLKTLIGARILAGLFGGPATSLAFSIIADVIPAERRGKAIGSVMSAVSIASVLGVPAGLRLSYIGGWRLPFIAVAAMGMVVAAGATFLLPSLRGHMRPRVAGEPSRLSGLLKILSRPLVQRSYAMTAVVMMAAFILVPNISAYSQYNLGFPRGELDLLYIAGGAAMFIALRFVGPLVDRFGSFRVGSVGAALVATVIWVWFIAYQPWIPLIVLFVAFMVSMSVRNVSYNTLTSRVPLPEERARFQSIQSSVQHMASALGAFLASRLLTTNATVLHDKIVPAVGDFFASILAATFSDQRLQGMPLVGWISIALSSTVPIMLWRVENGLKQVERPSLQSAARRSS